ncbi:hypothetical protein KY337_03640 [Candidatus Woesearchaeota archaeon]|nr:hypothetical protein [Candidatus Woesearchaeota archaeon]
MLKKSQITLFIILGMVVIMVFGVTMYAVKISTTTKQREEGTKILTETIQVSGIQNYIEECLDQTIEDALLKLGRQGGRLYDFQGGSMIPGKSVRVDSNLVSYGITKPLLAEETNYPPPFAYPCLGPLDSCPRNLYLGTNALPGLCDFNGPNKKGAQFFLPCPTYDFASEADHSSVQEQLQTYISNKTKECINFSAIGIKDAVVEGDINTSVVIGRNNIEVTLVYPLELRISGEEPVIELLEFSAKYPVRLMKIFEIAATGAGLIGGDNNQLNFKILESFKKPALYDKDINVNMFSRVCSDCGLQRHDALLVIQDKESIVNNTPYTMQFMIENRFPVLDWIGHFPKIDGYDIIVLEGEPINFTVQGYDPDDLDELNYGVYGWKEDYDEFFNYEEFELNPALTPDNFITILPAQHYWSTSPEFPNGSYTTAKKDIGQHNMTIQVKDKSGLRDWQNISILIADKPVIKAKAKKIYSDIDENIASIEDYFELDGEIFAAFTTVINPVWIDLTTGNRYTDLAQKIPDAEIDIRDIKSAEFTQTGIHNFELRIDTNYAGSIPELLDIDVKKCVPHTSTDPVYPFNQGNPFQADHACCTVNYEYETDKICFEETTYQCRPESAEEIGSTIKAIIEDDSGAITNPDLRENIQLIEPTQRSTENDVYVRTFKQKCSGTRGNICSGDIEEIWEPSACNDWEGDETERCQGPAADYGGCDSINKPQCYDFDGTTFEKSFNINDIYGNPATGACNTHKCSSPDLSVDTGFNNGGYIACDATCYFGECKRIIAGTCVCDIACTPNSAACDGKKPGQATGKCDFGEPYFEDLCTSRCEYEDNPDKDFKCIGQGCSCDVEDCDGLSEGSSLSRCDFGGESFFIDECDEQASARDSSSLCVSNAAIGCTADLACHNVIAGTTITGCADTFFPASCGDDCTAVYDQTVYKTIGVGCDVSWPSECDNVDRFGLTTDGWCYEESGILKLCTGAVVDIDNDQSASSSDKCGCWGAGGLPCDEDFDGAFDGTCLAGTCTELLF